ncbi:MAG: electron transport complex subunit RsxB [Rhizobacter sp.]|nr:electron transport complex subunit RsxB [Rhizobacter sp.]
MPASVNTAVSAIDRLARQLDAALPQTQCTRCGYPDCAGYARAMAEGMAGIDQCPPGGQEGVARLARITGLPVLPLDPVHGTESARLLAVIDEAWCIGCTLCLNACPVDCIVGGPKQMHTVIDNRCTGCELCIPACPVDCISLRPVTGQRTGWSAWSEAQATEARERYAFHRMRLARDDAEQQQRLSAGGLASPAGSDASKTEAPSVDSSRPRSSVIEAALARSRAARLR